MRGHAALSGSLSGPPARLIKGFQRSTKRLPCPREKSWTLSAESRSSALGVRPPHGRATVHYPTEMRLQRRLRPQRAMFSRAGLLSPRLPLAHHKLHAAACVMLCGGHLRHKEFAHRMLVAVCGSAGRQRRASRHAPPCFFPCCPPLPPFTLTHSPFEPLSPPASPPSRPTLCLCKRSLRKRYLAHESARPPA